MANIIVDFRDTFNKVKRIEQLSNQVNRIATRTVDGIGENIPSVWTGDGADRYQKKLNKINARIKKRAQDLNKNARGLEASANRLKKAEEYAKTLFSKK